MRRILHVFAMLALVAPLWMPAQGAQLGPHYLLVVDTSFSMARQKQAVAQIASRLVRNGFAGQIKSGQSFGIWTFNERIYANRFHPQTWETDRASLLADSVAGFLSNQWCEKQTRMDQLIAELTRAMAASESLTAMLFSDGDTPIRGTPFDSQINVIYQRHGRELRRAKLPFVTVLTARGGRMMAWSVHRGNEAIRLPEVPEPAPATPNIAAMPPPTPVTNSHAINPEKSSPRLIEPVESTTPSAASLNAQSTDVLAATNATIASAPANLSTVSQAMPEALKPVETADTVASPRVEPPPAALEAKASATATPKPLPEAVADPPRVEPGPQPATLTSDPPEPRQQPGESIAEKDSPEWLSVSAGTKPTAESAMAANANSPVSTNALVAQASAPDKKGYFIAGVAFLASAFGLLAWWLRSNRPSQASFISRSIDREKEQ